MVKRYIKNCFGLIVVSLLLTSQVPSWAENITAIAKNKKDKNVVIKRTKPDAESASKEALKGCKLYFEPYGESMQEACYIDSITSDKKNAISEEEVLTGGIEDLQIEGVSIGDSLLNYFTEEQILDNKKNWYKNKKFTTSAFTYFRTSYSGSTYDEVQFSYYTNDKNYILHGIDALVDFRKIEDCYIKLDEIALEFSEAFKDAKKSGKEINNHSDHNIPGKNTVTDILFRFDNRDLLIVACYDHSTESGYKDNLRISVRRNEFDDFLGYAY